MTLTKSNSKMAYKILTQSLQFGSQLINSLRSKLSNVVVFQLLFQALTRSQKGSYNNIPFFVFPLVLISFFMYRLTYLPTCLPTYLSIYIPQDFSFFIFSLISFQIVFPNLSFHRSSSHLLSHFSSQIFLYLSNYTITTITLSSVFLLVLPSL